METGILWTVFGVVVTVMMALDLGVFHRKAHDVSVREALIWTAVWVALGLGFGAFVWIEYDRARAAEYFACYLTEYALSVDNIFVFLVIFTYFSVPSESRHRVLFWGILGALLMRAAFLLGGVALIQKFHWSVYVLGAILIATGIKLLVQKEGDVHPDRNLTLRLARRLLPVTTEYEGQRFFVVRNGRRYATPLFLTLLVVESTDVMFAVDSVPAALSLSKDLLVVYTSNVFAILGLRSLFFAVAGLLQYLHYLKYGLSAILVFVGIKMVLPEERKIPIEIALSVVGGILAVAVIASMLRAKLVPHAKEEPGEKEAPRAKGAPGTPARAGAAVVCGTDFSDASASTADAAAAVAKAWQARLELVHALESSEDERPRALASLEREVQRLSATGISVGGRVESGASHEVVLRIANEVSARLVAVGAVGRRGGAAAFLLGSTADRVAQASRQPVLVVRGDALARRLRTGERMKVLVAVDASPTSDAAVRWTAELERAGPCEFVFAHVFWPPGNRDRGDARGLADVDGPKEKELRARIQALRGGTRVELRMVGGFGRVADHIVQIAEKEQADLVVVGTRQEHGFARMWHGSVSHGVIHAAPMSVVSAPS